MWNIFLFNSSTLNRDVHLLPDSNLSTLNGYNESFYERKSWIIHTGLIFFVKHEWNTNFFFLIEQVIFSGGELLSLIFVLMVFEIFNIHSVIRKNFKIIIIIVVEKFENCNFTYSFKCIQALSWVSNDSGFKSATAGFTLSFFIQE